MPHSTQTFNHLDLFSGIGGFAYAVDQVWPNATHTFCDNDLFCQKVLAKHWPESKIYGDINGLIDGLQTGIIQPCLSQDHVHTVKKNQEQVTQTGERNALQKQPEIGSMEAKKDTRSTSNGYGKPHTSYEQTSFSPMEGNVFVAEKQSHLFSPLTTSMEEEQKREKASSDYNSTEKLETKGIRKSTSCSVTTAITESTGLEYALTRPVDIVTGGFPCQSFSQAGKRLGTADARWLWPQMFRIIQLTKPTIVLAENVRGLVNWQGGVAFKQVLTDLESEGYSTQSFIIPACAVNAPHRRDRVWIVANSKHERRLQPKPEEQSRHKEGVFKGGSGDASNSTNRRLEQRLSIGEAERNLSEQSKRNEWEQDWLTVAARLCRVDDELSPGLDFIKRQRVARLKALGNSIVPAVAVEIMKAIKYAS